MVWIPIWNLSKSHRKHAKAAHTENRTNEVLRICKEHGDPFTLKEKWRKNDKKNPKKDVTEELLIRKPMYQHNQKESPALYKLNSMSMTQMKIDLGIMISGNYGRDTNDIVYFADKLEMLNVLN